MFVIRVLHIVALVLTVPHRYRSFRQSAFTNCGSLLTLSGINDDLISMEGTTASISPPVGEVLYDEAYKNQAWTGSESFIFSDELPGGNDQLGPDSSEAPSSSDSSSGNSSDNDSHE